MELSSMPEWLFLISSSHSLIPRCPLSTGESGRSAHRKTYGCLGILQIRSYIFLKIKKTRLVNCVNQSSAPTTEIHYLMVHLDTHLNLFLLAFLVPMWLCKGKDMHLYKPTCQDLVPIGILFKSYSLFMSL